MELVSGDYQVVRFVMRRSRHCRNRLKPLMSDLAGISLVTFGVLCMFFGVECEGWDHLGSSFGV